MNPTQIKQPRLSEESTTESSTSGSGDSEDRPSDEDQVAVAPAPVHVDIVAPPVPVMNILPQQPLVNQMGPWETEDEFLAYLQQFPGTSDAGRYTDADTDFADDSERLTPPTITGYAPRGSFRPRGGGGGGRPYQNHHHHQGHSNRGYSSNRGGYQHNYRKDHRQDHRQGGYNQGQHYHRGNFRSTHEEERRGGGGDHYGNRYEHQRGRGGYEGGGRGRAQKRKTDHSQSFDQNSQFYARPIGGGKHSRLSSNSSEDDVHT